MVVIDFHAIQIDIFFQIRGFKPNWLTFSQRSLIFSLKKLVLEEKEETEQLFKWLLSQMGLVEGPNLGGVSCLTQASLTEARTPLSIEVPAAGRMKNLLWSAFIASYICFCGNFGHLTSFSVVTECNFRRPHKSKPILV